MNKLVSITDQFEQLIFLVPCLAPFWILGHKQARIQGRGAEGRAPPVKFANLANKVQIGVIFCKIGEMYYTTMTTVTTVRL